MRLLLWAVAGSIVIPASLHGQVVNAEEPQTIMGEGAAHGAFVGGDIQVTELAGEAAMGLRFEGAWIGAHRLVAGLGVAALIPPSRRSKDVEIESLGYVGVMLGYRMDPARLVHGTAGVLIGAGGLEIAGTENGRREDDAVFVAEPSIGLELNATSFARLGLGLSYRFLGGVGLAGLGDQDLSGFAGQVGVRLGRF